MRITVVGAGACGFITAAHASLLGHEVALYEFPEFKDSIKDINKNGGIHLETSDTGSLPSGLAKIALVTTDAEEALKGSDMVIVAVPSYGEARAAEVCAPHLRDGQDVYLSSGYMYGSLEFSRTLKKCGNDRQINIAEMNNNIYAGAKTDSTTVFAGGYKRGLAVASFPGKNTPSILAKLKILYPEVVPFENIIETGISNPNPSLHVTTVVFNACYVDRKEDVLLYHDDKHLAAMSEAVSLVNEDMNDERMKLVEKGVFKSLRPWKYLVRDWYTHIGVKGESVIEIMTSHVGLSRSKLPKTFDHRYLNEDVTAGLLPLIEILERYAIPCPTNKSMAHLASRLSGIDLYAQGRTLAHLGLGHLSNDALFDYLKNG